MLWRYYANNAERAIIWGDDAVNKHEETKMRYRLAVILVLTASIAVAGTATISGTVVDEQISGYFIGFRERAIAVHFSLFQRFA